MRKGIRPGNSYPNSKKSCTKEIVRLTLHVASRLMPVIQFGRAFIKIPGPLLRQSTEQ